MATYGLWYFKARGGVPGEFPNAGTPSTLKSLGFDYAVALYSSAKDESTGDLLYGGVPYSGITYEDGYNDALKFAGWIDSKLKGIDYLVFIPVLADDYSLDFGSRTPQYLKGWVDGIYDNTSNYQKGFYWYLEFPWQVHDGVVYEETIQEISSYIRNKSQQFIWSPYVHDGINPDGTDIKSIANYFTYVFIQSNYYQGKTSDFNRWYNEVLLYLRNKYGLNNLYMELECDGGVNSPDPETATEYRERACTYVDYAINFPHRAYYYGTNLQNVQTMEEYCNAQGKKYVF